MFSGAVFSGAVQARDHYRSLEHPYAFRATQPHPNGSFKSARLMAKAWAKEFSDEKRIAAARLFIAEAIATFAKDLALDSGLEFVFVTPAPEGLVSGKLDRPANSLAVTLGEEAACLDPVSAGYWLSATYTAMLPDEMRARLGIYYTPPALSRRLIEMAGEAGVNWANACVLDPACGGGAFLAPVAAKMLEVIAHWTPAAILDHVGAKLRGLEIDAFAAWMSQVFLEITMSKVCRSAGRALPQLVTVCDTLEEEPSRAYDLVIGNPPYGRMTLTPALREKYRRSLYGHANLYGVFTDLALRWTVAGGVIAYVTPTSFLAGEYFKNLRSLIAAEAPPVAIDFIADRKDVFENVLQEALLATYRKGATAGKAAVHHLTVSQTGAAINPAGEFDVSRNGSAPWLLPRLPEHKRLVSKLAGMKTRIADWGYTISTGPLVWNRHKGQLRSRPCKDSVPLIWAEAIAGPGRFIFRAEKQNHEPYFKLLKGDEWLKIDKPCVLIQRTTAKEQSRRLIAAVLPETFIAEHGAVVVENHLNMVRPLNGEPKVSAAAVAAILNSEIVDHTFRCISGSVAVSAFELEALPLPSIQRMQDVEEILRQGAGGRALETELQSIYLGQDP